MSEQVLIKVKEVRLSEETEGLKIVITEEGAKHKFSKTKKEGGERSGWGAIASGEWNVYLTDDKQWITAAFPKTAHASGGFKKPYQSYKPDPQTQIEIVRQNCCGNAVQLVNTYASGKFDLSIQERIKMTLDVAKQLESWVKEGRKTEC